MGKERIPDRFVIGTNGDPIEARFDGERRRPGAQPKKKQPLLERLLFLSRAEGQQLDPVGATLLRHRIIEITKLYRAQMPTLMGTATKSRRLNR